MAIGNSYNDEERCVLAGYDNGDIKMFDMRMNKVRRGLLRQASVGRRVSGTAIGAGWVARMIHL